MLKSPDVTLTRASFLGMLLQGRKLPDLVEAGAVKLKGDPRAFAAVFANFENFDPNFNIVTP